MNHTDDITKEKGSGKKLKTNSTCNSRSWSENLEKMVYFLAKYQFQK